MRRDGRHEDNDDNQRVLTIELEFSRDWSSRNPIPWLGLLVSEHRDFTEIARASNIPSGAHGDDSPGSLDTAHPALRRTASVLVGHFANDAEPGDDRPRPHDREGIVRV